MSRKPVTSDMSSSSEVSRPRARRVRPYLLVLLAIVAVGAAAVTGAPAVARARRQAAARQALAAELAGSWDGVDTLRRLDSLEGGRGRVTRDPPGPPTGGGAGIPQPEPLSSYNPRTVAPLAEAGRGGAEAAHRALQTMGDDYSVAARDALWTAMSVMDGSSGGASSRRPGPRESIALSYAVCALADCVAADPVGPWLALAITNARQHAVTAVRQNLSWVPPQTDAGRALDDLVLEQNRLLVRITAERQREPADPLLQDLLTDPDQAVAAGAYVRVQRELEGRLRAVLSESAPVAERLRRVLLEADGQDPRGGLGDCLRRQPLQPAGVLPSSVGPLPPAQGATGPFVLSDEQPSPGSTESSS